MFDISHRFSDVVAVVTRKAELDNEAHILELGEGVEPCGPEGRVGLEAVAHAFREEYCFFLVQVVDCVVPVHVSLNWECWRVKSYIPVPPTRMMRSVPVRVDIAL